MNIELNENKTTIDHQCKACDNTATIEDPKERFYCDECYSLFNYTRKHYWSHPEATGYLDKK